MPPITAIEGAACSSITTIPGYCLRYLPATQAQESYVRDASYLIQDIYTIVLNIITVMLSNDIIISKNSDQPFVATRKYALRFYFVVRLQISINFRYYINYN